MLYFYASTITDGNVLFGLEGRCLIKDIYTYPSTSSPLCSKVSAYIKDRHIIYVCQPAFDFDHMDKHTNCDP